MRILVTGCAGFIGHHVSNKLVRMGHDVVGLDNLNKYYDSNLKRNRLKETYKVEKKSKGSFKFFKCDICNIKKTISIFKKFKFKKVIHLAAQAGIRYSIKNPGIYTQTNLNGTFNILELSKVSYTISANTV